MFMFTLLIWNKFWRVLIKDSTAVRINDALCLKESKVTSQKGLCDTEINQGVPNRWKSMIGKAIDQSMPIDACQLIGIDWYRPIDDQSIITQKCSWIIDCHRLGFNIFSDQKDYFNVSHQNEVISYDIWSIWQF